LAVGSGVANHSLARSSCLNYIIATSVYVPEKNTRENSLLTECIITKDSHHSWDVRWCRGACMVYKRRNGTKHIETMGDPNLHRGAGGDMS